MSYKRVIFEGGRARVVCFQLNFHCCSNQPINAFAKFMYLRCKSFPRVVWREVSAWYSLSSNYFDCITFEKLYLFSTQLFALGFWTHYWISCLCWMIQKLYNYIRALKYNNYQLPFCWMVYFPFSWGTVHNSDTIWRPENVACCHLHPTRSFKLTLRWIQRHLGRGSRRCWLLWNPCIGRL